MKFSSVGRRKLSMSQLLSAADPSQAQQPPSPHQHTSSFYIGLAESGNNNNSNNNNNKVRLLNIIKEGECADNKLREEIVSHM